VVTRPSYRGLPASRGGYLSLACSVLPIWLFRRHWPLVLVAFWILPARADITVYTTTIVENAPSTSFGTPSSSPSVYRTTRLTTSTHELRAGDCLSIGKAPRCGRKTYEVTEGVTDWVTTTPTTVVQVDLTRVETITSSFAPAPTPPPPSAPPPPKSAGDALPALSVIPDSDLSAAPVQMFESTLTGVESSQLIVTEPTPSAPPVAAPPGILTTYSTSYISG
jgi:hypothetical protein